MTAPKTVEELNELLSIIFDGWDARLMLAAASHRDIGESFGPYLLRRLAEHGVQMVPMLQPGQYKSGRYDTMIEESPYYTEVEP